MERFIGSSRSLTLGLAASTVLHALGVVALSRFGPTFGPEVEVPREDRTNADQLVVDPPPQPLVLGIDEPTPNKTDTWLGFADPTEHKARAATVEQAAMDPLPGAGGTTAGSSTPASSQDAAPAGETPSRSSNDATHVQAPQPQLTKAAEKSAADELQPAPTDPRDASPQAPGNASRELEMSDAAIKPAASDATTLERPDALPSVTPPREVIEPAPVPVERADPEPEAQPARPATPPAEVVPKPATAPGNAPAGDRPGEKSDRQSSPTSLKDTIDVVLGKPAAAQGLEIKTVKPRWSDTTKLTAAPRNPVVRVTFAKSGKVTNVQFVAGQNTGWRDVDEPLLDAIYRWSAKGEAVRALPDGKSQGLTVQFRIMLR